MNERLMCLQLYAGEAGVTLANGSAYATLPFDFTIVAVSARPSADDAGATIDLRDDGTDIITGVTADTAATPGTWLSTHVGGTQTPVHVAADSVLAMDVNTVDAGTVISAQIWGLIGEKH